MRSQAACTEAWRCCAAVQLRSTAGSSACTPAADIFLADIVERVHDEEEVEEADARPASKHPLPG